MDKNPKPNFSKHRRVENELLFKQENTRMKDITASLQGHSSTLPIPFYCECADLNCSDIISLSNDEYEQFHAHPDWYIVKKGHEQPDIEKVLEKQDRFLLIEKFESVTA